MGDATMVRRHTQVRSDEIGQLTSLTEASRLT